MTTVSAPENRITRDVRQTEVVVTIEITVRRVGLRASVVHQKGERVGPHKLPPPWSSNVASHRRQCGVGGSGYSTESPSSERYLRHLLENAWVAVGGMAPFW